MYTFYVPVKLIGGEGAISSHREQFAALGKSCLLVTGRHSAKASGAFQDVTDALESQGISWQVYDAIGENPLLESCREAGRMAQACGADFVVGIGGGSPMDAAKAVAALAGNPELPQEELFACRWEKEPLPIVLVGTTSGTGSEVSPTSVLTCPDGRKRSITHPALFAAVAFGDPRYTYTMSWSSTVSTGLDALSHAVEGYFSPKSSKITDGFAEMAIPVLWKHLYALWKGEELTETMHRELYEASLWAGYVLASNGTSFPHPFGYFLTEQFQVPHGRACTTFMPAFFDWVSQKAPEKAGKVLELCGCSGEVFRQVTGELSDTGWISMTEEEIQALRPRFTGLKHYGNVPGGYDADRALDVYKKLFLKTAEK